MLEDYNLITRQIIQCAMEVHKSLGPGLMESVYNVCLYEEMRSKGIAVERQKILPVTYKGSTVDKDFVIDHLVEDKIILELKSVETILPVHEAQLVTYLKLSEKKLGLLINFNVYRLKDGICRKINGSIEPLKKNYG